MAIVEAIDERARRRPRSRRSSPSRRSSASSSARPAGPAGRAAIPSLYWFAVFGEPGTEREPWSWRIGGHHVAIQLTLADGRVIGSAPSFLGANPAVVPSGPTRGRRALTGEETLARALLAALTPEQRRVAVVDAVAPPDIRSGTGRAPTSASIPIGDPPRRARRAAAARARAR